MASGQSLNTPVNAKNMLTWGFEIYVGLKPTSMVRLWVFKDVDTSFGGETTEDIYTNYKTKKVKNGDQYNINLSVHEITPQTMAIIFNGMVDYIKNSGTTASVTDSKTVGEWSYDDPVRLSKFNSNLSAVTITSVKVGAKVLVVAKDYKIVTNGFGRSFIEVINPSTTGYTGQLTAADLNQVLEIVFEAVSTSEEMLYKSSGLATGFHMMINWEGTHNNTKLSYQVELRDCKADQAFVNLIGDSDDGTAALPLTVAGTIVSMTYEWFGVA